ncbi:hypothetical protein GCM10023081_20170 [Arthrobacter ginkgonis]|uniref:Uncharacterized protein n=1 Tax=Arthrobacter ginkgonis TaxID=1630594 RepID=A0ABP7C719_9MICC
MENGVIETSSVFGRRGGELALMPSADLSHHKLERAGIDVADLMEVVS